MSNTSRVSNILDLDQAQYFAWPDLGPNCLQKPSVDETRRQRVNPYLAEYIYMIFQGKRNLKKFAIFRQGRSKFDKFSNFIPSVTSKLGKLHSYPNFLNVSVLYTVLTKDSKSELKRV